MSTQPKVSVIIPSLNVGKYVSECLESVIHQTLKDLEIICVDAGSTDGTYEILKEYEELSDIVLDIKSGVSVNSESIECKENEVGVLKTSSVYGNKFNIHETKSFFFSIF